MRYNTLRPVSWPEGLWLDLDARLKRYIDLLTLYINLIGTKRTPFDAPELDERDGAKIAALRSFLTKLFTKNRSRTLEHLTWRQRSPVDLRSWSRLPSAGSCHGTYARFSREAQAQLATKRGGVVLVFTAYWPLPPLAPIMQGMTSL